MMKASTKINIVMFWFMNDWGKYGRAYEKIAEHLAQQPEINRVVCVLPKNKIESVKFSLPLSFAYKSRKLWVVSQNSAVVPSNRAPYKLRKWINRAVPDTSLQFFLKSLGLKKANTFLWLYPPHEYIENLVELVPHFSKIVQVVDNNSFLEAATDEYRQSVKNQYDFLSKSADCIIVSSDANYDYFSKINRRCFLFENAVDNIFIQDVSTLPFKLNSGRPRLGYLGWLTKRTDIGLLKELAVGRPDCDIILAGPVGAIDIGFLVSLPNVFWLGNIPYEEVPDVIKSFDVCLIPHIDNEYSRSMSPLKLFQYLGSGRPIVTTRVAGVDRWSEHVYISESNSQFLTNVSLAMEQDSNKKAKMRINTVSKETWDGRVKAMLKDIFSFSS